MGKVVNWFGNNLWAIVVAVAGLLYVAAKEWITKYLCVVLVHLLQCCQLLGQIFYVYHYVFITGH